ncbi:hypothetical protein J8M20_06265 [Pseudoalteromonas luteoviolacea]|uniref:hypothetical protein n=1 Tax=Pseudoalteromonas luteoviolacea TaxID=43657 RepID=UPI001B399C9D|nr:hypothetical protein [Pseudoalteromonas luteoviolacea]MBQ4810931.1 hypothetical protein [Pseudoalteromonas luteoviolacea]
MTNLTINKKVLILLLIFIALSVTVSLRFLPKEIPQYQPAVAHTERNKIALLPQPNNNLTSPHEHVEPVNIEGETDARTNDSGQLRVMDKPQWKLPNNFYSVFTALKIAAENGDAEAKYVIAMNLEYCLFAPLDDTALQKKLDEYASDGYGTSSMDTVIEQFNYCNYISQSERSLFFSYLEDAANSGSVAAQAHFSKIRPEFYMELQGYKSLARDEYIHKRDTYMEQRVSFLKQAGLHGSEQALKYLSYLYHSHQLSQNSLANAYALNKLIAQITDNSDTHNRYAKYEQNQYLQLTAEELDTANEIYERWISTIRANGTYYPSKY